jgi:hypothetical protein
MDSQQQSFSNFYEIISNELCFYNSENYYILILNDYHSLEYDNNIGFNVHIEKIINQNILKVLSKYIAFNMPYGFNSIYLDENLVYIVTNDVKAIKYCGYFISDEDFKKI